VQSPDAEESHGILHTASRARTENIRFYLGVENNLLHSSRDEIRQRILEEAGRVG
jgi:hypothetical protein